MGELRMPNGTVYRTGEREFVVSKDAARRGATSADLAKVGAAVVRAGLAREEVVKELRSAAERWDKAALDLPVGNELRDYYKTKAANARERAEELRKGRA